MQSNRKRIQVVGNSSLGAPFALGENFGEQQTKSLVATPKFSLNTKLPPQILEFDLKTDSANPQNLNKNNPRVSANLKSRPLRGAKNLEQGRSSASADFLLEADKRGSPPKSEKRQLLARRGSGAGGAALLRKEKNNNENAESTLDSAILLQSRLPRRFCESARNDDSFLDSANQRKPAKSTLDSAIFALLKQ